MSLQGNILNYKIKNVIDGTKPIVFWSWNSKLAGKQEAGIKSESALPYERLDIYIHYDDCLAQISWDEVNS